MLASVTVVSLLPDKFTQFEWLDSKTVPYAKTSPKMVDLRDIAGENRSRRRGRRRRTTRTRRRRRRRRRRSRRRRRKSQQIQF